MIREVSSLFSRARICGRRRGVDIPDESQFSVAIPLRVVTFSVLMKCDSCQEKATVFYTQVSEGKLKKFVLCEACAQAQGITNPEGLLMAEELLGQSQTPEGIPEISPLPSLDKCQRCGFTLDDFQKVGRLGCPDCYRAFSGEIAQRLPSMHKGQVHAGYVPAGLVKQQALRNELSDLEAGLAAAIAEEDFEKAAQLRDRIAEVKNAKEEGATAS